MLVALFMLTGCGATYDVGPEMGQLAAAQETGRAECMKAYAESQKVDCTGMDSRDCMMVKVQQQTAILVGMATGKSANPCGEGSNLFDVMKEEVAQKNESLRSGMGVAGGVAKIGLGVWGATEIVDSIGKNAGSTSTVNTEGGDSTISNTRSNTETNTDVSNTGEEGTATTSGGFSSDPVAPVNTTGEPALDPATEVSDETITVTND